MTEQSIAIFAAIAAIFLIQIVFSVRKKQRQKVIKEILNRNPKIIDVRSKAEFQSGHFPGALNIPLDALDKKAAGLGAKDSEILVYCASGARAGSATALLKSKGFSKVLNAGGLSSMPH